MKPVYQRRLFPGRWIYCHRDYFHCECRRGIVWRWHKRMRPVARTIHALAEELLNYNGVRS